MNQARTRTQDIAILPFNRCSLILELRHTLELSPRVGLSYSKSSSSEEQKHVYYDVSYEQYLNKHISFLNFLSRILLIDSIHSHHGSAILSR